MNHTTFTLPGRGVSVLARRGPDGYIDPYRYMTLAQAQARADSIGGSVLKLGRCHYVVPPGGNAHA